MNKHKSKIDVETGGIRRPKDRDEVNRRDVCECDG
jgi:hypothetical protein